jgi:hypothetical protein
MLKSESDETVAGAFGLAAFHFQNAILTTLVAKGHLTMKEAALTAKGALIEFDKHHPSSETELVPLARLALQNLFEAWQSQARGH